MQTRTEERPVRQPKELLDREPSMVPMICYTAAQEAIQNDWTQGFETLTLQRLSPVDELNIPASARRIFLWRYLNWSFDAGGPDIFDKQTMGAGVTQEEFLDRIGRWNFDKMIAVDENLRKGFSNAGVVVKVQGDDGEPCYFLFKRDSDQPGEALNEATLIPESVVVMHNDTEIFQTLEPASSSFVSHDWVKFKVPETAETEK